MDEHPSAREDHWHSVPRLAARVLLAAVGVERTLHVVRDWAGHASISTTSRYLAVPLAAMQKAVKGFEEHSERAGAQPKASTPDAVHPTVQ